MISAGQPGLALIGQAEASPRTARVLPLWQDAVPAAYRAAAMAAGFTGRRGETLTLFGQGELRLLLLLGLGPAEEGGGAGAAAEDAGAEAAATLRREAEVVLDGRGLPRSLATRLMLGAALRAWQPAQQRQGHRLPGPEVSEITRLALLVEEPERQGQHWKALLAVHEAICLARGLIAEPANSLTPKVFAERLEALTEAGITVEILSGKTLAARGLRLLAAVGQASANPPHLVVLRWAGKLDLPPVAFVGKGITFDTGGLCIKPADQMWDMRGDMAGAAVCAGALLALARRRSPAPAVAVLALAENMIGAESYRPGDVIASHAGPTVEIIDTDAEGRLALADALSYTIARFQPRAVIDLATLTYAVGLALGREMAGLYDNDATLAAQLAAAGHAVGEPLWRMPVTTRDREALTSDIADIRHCLTGPLTPDATLAAAFLRAFVGETPWAHIDIGAVDLREEAEGRYVAGPTAFGVRLLDRLIANRYEDPDHP
ncbi:leucyl aminopeptidase family protein [Acidisoma sp. C75]